jgi:alpha-tubulin suppressor-like RCC1 family protein
VVYVSLAPGSVPTGTQATVRNQTSGGSITTAVVNGGFDPVAIAAAVGDTLLVEVRGPSTDVIRAVLVVAAQRPLVVVRTNPPPRKTDVPLNAIMVVVFSAPIDSTTLTTESVQLWSGTTPVPGTVRFADVAHLRAEFHPDGLLAAETDHELVVTQGIRDVNGQALASPVAVPFTTGTTAPATGLVFASVSVGGSHTCGVTTAGAAYCWGGNWRGQLGDGTTTDRTSPVLVRGGLTFAHVSAGWTSHTCGLATGETAYCWGSNWGGQLGDGTTSDRTSPVLVLGALSFAQVSAGYGSACGVTTTGAAYCWGWSGEDGNGGTNRTSPVPMPGELTFAHVSAGFGGGACGVTPAGAAYCWSQGNPELPGLVLGGLAFAQVEKGWGHTCGMTAAGAAYCWGDNESGQLGDGTTTPNYWSPVPVLGELTFAEVSAGTHYSCGVTTGGAAYCWGWNSVGQLGDGTTTDRTTPVPVLGGLTFARVSAGYYHTCGVTTTGAAYCWGENNYGQLGNGTTTPSTVPVKVAGQP